LANISKMSLVQMKLRTKVRISILAMGIFLW